MEKKKKEEEQKNGKKDKVLTILLIALIILTVILIISFFIKGKNLDTDSSLVTEIHNYFSTDDLTNCEGLFNYTDKKITNKDISTETKLCIAYQKANKKGEEEELTKEKKKETCTNEEGMIFRITENTDVCTVNKIPKKAIDDTYKKIFNQEIKDNQEFKADNTHICYLKEDKYYCGLSETFSYIMGNEATIYRVIKEARQKGSEIILYDYFLKISGYTCYKNYTPTTINAECTNNLKDAEIDYTFMEKYATKYKHIYKKASDGTYYWVSSEPVE